MFYYTIQICFMEIHISIHCFIYLCLGKCLAMYLSPKYIYETVYIYYIYVCVCVYVCVWSFYRMHLNLTRSMGKTCVDEFNTVLLGNY